MIENKCREWYHSEECTVHSLVEYIEKTGKMRDAQVEAIKLYLFLKIGCGCKPLELLFRHGYFNSINLNDVELSTTTRAYLEENPAAAALFEYALLTNDRGEQVSEGIEKQIKKDPSSIDYHAFFQAVFYNVSYTDYLFSLPMGAGKTYLMAAFIYLDLYFANNEPQNPAFAHNFIIFAPSGLKSSVVPSLKTMHQYADNTMKKRRGAKAPTIDFCFKDWSTSNSYFGAEAKNLYKNRPEKIKRYVSTGVENYTTGRYGSQSSESSMIGYVLSGKIQEITEELKIEMAKETPLSNLARTARIEPQYKSSHVRTLDNHEITLHHLFFDFASS